MLSKVAKEISVARKAEETKRVKQENEEISSNLVEPPIKRNKQQEFPLMATSTSANSNKKPNNNNENVNPIQNVGGDNKNGQQKGTLTLRIFEQNSAAVGIEKSTPQIEIGGIQWRMNVKCVGDDRQQLLLHLHANEDVLDRLWWCYMKYTCRVVQQRKMHNYTYEPEFWFNDCAIEIDYLRELGITAANQQQGPITIQLEICVKQVVLNGLPQLDTQLLLIGNDKHIWVNKNILSGFSGYFCEIFKNSRRDRDFRIMDIEKEEMDAFVMMLYGVHIFGCGIGDRNLIDLKLAKQILSLAGKYQMPIWLDYCVEFLCEDNTLDKIELLEIAERENVAKLKEHCLASVDVLEYGKNFARNKEIHARLGKQTRDRLDEILGQSSKRISMSLGRN